MIRMPTLIYSLISAYTEGEDRHAQEVMAELGAKLGFSIEAANPETIIDGWVFRIGGDIDLEKLPRYLKVMKEDKAVEYWNRYYASS